MAENLNQLEKQFYSDGYRLGMRASNSAADKNLLLSSVHEMYAAVDEFIDSLLEFARANNQNVDCKRGCSWCCYQPVFALDYEIEALNDFINREFDSQTRTEIHKKATSKQHKLHNLKGETLLNSKFPCPLLKEGYCLAYKARPMACRIYLSSSLETCLKFFNEPEDKENYPALLQFPMRMGRLMNEGFKSALKSRGIILNEFRIEEGILQKPSTF
jgi:Fe-S-cluster containining protein